MDGSISHNIILFSLRCVKLLCMAIVSLKVFMTFGMLRIRTLFYESFEFIYFFSYSI